MCTAISFTSGSHCFGRTLDIEHLYGEAVTVIPRSFKIDYSYGGANDSHYAIIGMATVADGYPLLYDGTNEMGLSIAGLNFSGNAILQEEDSAKRCIAGYELPLVLLAECKSTDEATALIEGAVITGKGFKGFGAAKLHWMICDKKRAVVLEITSGGMRIHENTVGVMANDPPFDFHMTNLRRYMHLTADEITSSFADGVELTPNSRGAGAIGLPGDYTSESRFVRAAFVKANAKKAISEVATVEQFFHILESVSVPDGCVRLAKANERTEYISCCNTDEGIYYYKTYGNSRIRAVKLHGERLDSELLVSYPIAEDTDFLYKN